MSYSWLDWGYGFCKKDPMTPTSIVYTLNVKYGCPHWPWSLGKHSVCQLLHRKATLFLSFFFFKSFLIWIIFKVFTEFVTILLLFYVLVFGPWGTWDLSFPRDGTSTPSIGRWSPNHWTAREVPKLLFLPLPPAFPSSGLLKEARTHGPHIRDGELCPTPGRVSVQQEWSYAQLLEGSASNRNDLGFFCTGHCSLLSHLVIQSFISINMRQGYLFYVVVGSTLCRFPLFCYPVD